MRQMKNTPQFFMFALLCIVKANRFSVKNYSQLKFENVLYPYTLTGRESSFSIQSDTGTTVYSVLVFRITTRSMPALMMSRRHMEQEVASGSSSPLAAARPAS